MVKAAISNTTS